MAPAAASLLHPGRYASAVLAGSGRLPALAVPFDYGSPAELASVGVSVVDRRRRWPGGTCASGSRCRSGCCARRTPARPTTTRPTPSPGRSSSSPRCASPDGPATRAGRTAGGLAVSPGGTSRRRPARSAIPSPGAPGSGVSAPPCGLSTPSNSSPSMRWWSWKYSTCRRLGTATADVRVQARRAVRGDLQVVRGGQGGAAQELGDPAASRHVELQAVHRPGLDEPRGVGQRPAVLPRGDVRARPAAGPRPARPGPGRTRAPRTRSPRSRPSAARPGPPARWRSRRWRPRTARCPGR